MGIGNSGQNMKMPIKTLRCQREKNSNHFHENMPLMISTRAVYIGGCLSWTPIICNYMLYLKLVYLYAFN